MELKLTERLIEASIDTVVYERVRLLAESVTMMIKKRSSLMKLKEIEVFPKGNELPRFVIETFKQQTELPTQSERNYSAYMMLTACSQEDFVSSYLGNDCNGITAVSVEECRTGELLFFCDLFCSLKGRDHLNGVINWVCHYFYLERKIQIICNRIRLKKREMECAKYKKNVMRSGKRKDLNTGMKIRVGTFIKIWKYLSICVL